MTASVYPDANAFIYYFDRHPKFYPIVAPLFEKAAQKQVRLFTTAFCLGEVLVLPTFNRDEFQVARIKFFFRSSAMRMLPFPPEAVPIYAELRARHRVKPLDALHLAAAAHAGTDLFLTNDQSLLGLTVPGIGAVAPIDHVF